MTTAAAGKFARRRVANLVFEGFCVLITLVALVALAAILWTLLQKGIGGINLDVFTKSTPAPGSRGGLANAIEGSAVMCVLAMVVAVIVGVLAGTWLAEYGGSSPYGSVIRFLNDVLLSAPSILVGVFIAELLVAHGMHHFSGVAGIAALSLLAIPVIVRTTEDVLRLQAQTLREAGVALGAHFSFVVRKILWRSARSGLLTGTLLAFARISGETAPLLFTALNNQFFSLDLTHPTANLPVVIFNYALSAYEDWVRLAWAGALLITAAVLAITVVARLVAQEQKRS
jgi:phosphate transport system permease protein